MVDDETGKPITETSPLLVSVIIPVLNDTPRLRLCLQHLYSQTYSRDLIEIIVVDNGSDDSLEPLKPEFPDVVWLFEPQRSSYAARNKGAYHASGDILAFTDSDCLPRPDWIQNGTDRLTRDDACDVVVGRIEHVYPHGEPRTLLEWYQSIFGFQQANFVRKYRFGATANLMVTRETFTKVGMFEGGFESGGDQYWGQKAAAAGHSLCYAPDVCVGHPTRSSYRAYFSRARRHARGLMSIDYQYRRSQRTILMRSLHPFIPRWSNFRTILQRRGKMPYRKVPAIFLLNWLLHVVRGSERLLVSLKNLARKTGFRLITAAWRFLPYPRLWALVSGSRIPDSHISGKGSGLVRPESITFSPSGDILAVSNSEGHSVTFYSEMQNRKGTYARTPCMEISNTVYLSYVHDAALSSCGRFLLTAARDAHGVSVFFPFGEGGPHPKSEPVCSVAREASSICLPTGVAVHPSGQFIAVANRKKHGITLYRQAGETGRFDTVPFQQVSDDAFYEHDLTSPCALDFSPDGQFLAVVHKRYTRTGKFWRGQSGLTVFRCLGPSHPGIDTSPARIRLHGLDALHSVCFHPTAKLLAVSIEGECAVIFSFSEGFEDIDEWHRFRVFGIGLTLKGIGFTRDGTQLAVTTALGEVLFFRLPARKLQAAMRASR